MSVSTLAALLRSGSAHAVSFSGNGSQRCLPELVERASRMTSAIRARSGARRFAIDLDDPFDFATALIGTWSAGRTAVVVPKTLLHSEAVLEIDGVIAGQGRSVERYPCLRLDDLATGEPSELSVSPDARTIVFTSGSTGQPKAVSRQLHNMEAEIGVLDAQWPIGDGRLFSTVSHRHIYGLLFRLLWPLLARRPMAAFDLQFPEELIRQGSDADALIASPALLKRIGHLEPGSSQWKNVFSSGGLLSADAAADSLRVLGTCPIEVLGSTETSGVAWRRQTPGAGSNWTVLPGVQIRTDSDGFLDTRSPFSGADDWVLMGDYAQLHDDTTFELLGRGDHLAKIEDKRISLAAIEQQLMQSGWVDDAAAVALESAGRQHVGAVVQLSASGREQLAQAGKRAVLDELRAALDGIEAIAIPRRFRFVEHIPVNAQGKREPRVLRGLFE